MNSFGKEYVNINKNKKELYRNIVLCAELRNISIDSQLYNVNIKEEDILNRLQEQELNELSTIDYKNRFNCADIDDPRVKEIFNEYDNIARNVKERLNIDNNEVKRK